jgi:hypothetical protein
MTIRLASTLFLLTLTLSSFCQTNSLVGEWTLSKHIAVIDGSDHDCAKLYDYMTLNFLADSTYNLHLKEKDVDVWTTFGKWKMTKDGKGILFYNNDSKPKRVNEFISNHTLPLKNLSATKLVIEERLCTTEKPGTSYYVKEKPVKEKESKH